MSPIAVLSIVGLVVVAFEVAFRAGWLGRAEAFSFPFEQPCNRDKDQHGAC